MRTEGMKIKCARCGLEGFVENKGEMMGNQNAIEKEKTYYTNERFLPRILVDLGLYPSINEIRRNKPELIKSLNNLDFIDGLRVKKKRKFWILVGE